MSQLSQGQSRWEGWERAIRFLADRPGTLWIVSPFITTTPTQSLLQGARVLTTISAQQLASGVSSYAAIRAMIEGGAEVRVCPKLHAKVYLRMYGSQAIGFTGSANMTQYGNHRNHEVMTGPEEFNVAFIRDLTAHWTTALPLTLDALDTLQRDAVRIGENLKISEQVATDVVVIIAETRMLRATFELTESKLGIPPEHRTAGLRAARVDFVKADDRKEGNALLREGLRRLQDGRSGMAVNMQGSGGLTYAVPLSDHARFQDGIESLDTEVKNKMRELVSQRKSSWREDFLQRLANVARTYNRAEPAQVELVLQEARQRFKEYVDPERLDVGIRYGTYLALQMQNRPLAHDYRTYFRGVREGQKLDLL